MKKKLIFFYTCLFLLLSTHGAYANPYDDIYPKIEQQAEQFNSEVETDGNTIYIKTGKEYDPYVGLSRFSGSFKVEGLTQFNETNQFTITFDNLVGTSYSSNLKYRTNMHKFIKQVIVLAGAPVTDQIVEDLDAVSGDNLPKKTSRKYGTWQVTIIPNQMNNGNEIVTYNTGHKIIIKRAGNSNKPDTKINGYSEANIKVILNGTEMNFKQKPVTVNNLTMLPLRDIFEGLGAKVEWIASTKSINATKGEINMRLQVGSNNSYINDKVIKIDVAPININGYIMVPLRVVAEGFGANINWEKANQTITINTIE